MDSVNSTYVAELEPEETIAEDIGINILDLEFDRVVGALQDILCDEEFCLKQSEFLNANCQEFEDNDDNKLSYMNIFSKYVEMMESYLDGQLALKLEGFNMERLMNLLASQPPEDLQGDVFDVLTALGDFSEFKSLMLSHKTGLLIGPLEPIINTQFDLTIIGSPLRSPVENSSFNKDKSEL